MKLYIMRHGEAESQGVSDEKRTLTEYGKTEVLDIAESIKSINFDVVIVSTFMRAQQTANIIKQHINYNNQTITSDMFCPESEPKKSHDYIDALLIGKSYRNVLIVSHMPLVSFLMAELTFDKQMPIFPTAALAYINYQPEQMLGEYIEMVCPFHACDMNE